AAAGPIEQAVLAREHDDRDVAKAWTALDHRAGLVAVEPRHQDVAEDQLGFVVGDLGQGIETILGEDHPRARLAEKDLGAATDGVAVVDDHHPNAGELAFGAHSSDLHHLEVLLAGAAFGTGPVHRDV